MPDIEADLNYLRAGLANLEEYLLSNELYWPIQEGPKHGEPPYPSLTISGLLLARTRLSAYQPSGSAQIERERLSGELDRILTKWRVAWEKKSAREFTARLNLWRNYLEDYREQPEAQTDRYAYEVSRRVMLDLLLAYLPKQIEAEIAMLSGLDVVLKSAFVPGEFIWGGLIEDAFPEKSFWYLYGRLR